MEEYNEAAGIYAKTENSQIVLEANEHSEDMDDEEELPQVSMVNTSPQKRNATAKEE